MANLSCTLRQPENQEKCSHFRQINERAHTHIFSLTNIDLSPARLCAFFQKGKHFCTYTHTHENVPKFRNLPTQVGSTFYTSKKMLREKLPGCAEEFSFGSFSYLMNFKLNAASNGRGQNGFFPGTGFLVFVAGS